MVAAGPAWAVLLLCAQGQTTVSRGEVVPLAPVVVPLPEDSPEPAPEAELPPSEDVTVARSSLDTRPFAHAARETSELVASLPGALSRDLGGWLQPKSLLLRGATESGTLVLLDGVPLNGAGGLADISLLPVSVLERVEVVRGAGALGGVVRLTTRAASGEQGVFGQLMAGSFLTSMAHVGGSSEALGGRVLIIAHGATSRGDFQVESDPLPQLEGNPLALVRRRNNDARAAGVLVRHEAAVSAQTRLSTVAQALAGARGLAGPLQNPTPDARQEDVRFSSAVALDTQALGGTLDATGFAHRDSLTLRGGLFGTPGPQVHHTTGARASFTRLLGDHGLSLTASISREWIWLREGARPWWLRSGLAVSDEILLAGGALSLVPSGRYERVGPFDVLSPRLGARWSVTDAWTLLAGVGRTHRAPSFLELYVPQGQLLANDELAPERGLSADATVRFLGERLQTELTGFFARYDALITYEYYPPQLARPYNLAGARFFGLELQARAAPLSWLSVEGAYTLTRSASTVEDPRYFGKPVPYRPAHQLHGRIVGSYRAVTARADAAFTSELFTNRSQTLRLPSRLSLNGGVELRPFGRDVLVLALEVKNALGTLGQDLDGYPLPPRAAYVTISSTLTKTQGTP